MISRMYPPCDLKTPLELFAAITSQQYFGRQAAQLTAGHIAYTHTHTYIHTHWLFLLLFFLAVQHTGLPFLPGFRHEGGSYACGECRTVGRYAAGHAGNAISSFEQNEQHIHIALTLSLLFSTSSKPLNFTIFLFARWCRSVVFSWDPR